MPITDGRTARVLITVLLFALGLGFLYVARQTLIAFLFAIFFAYLMSPLFFSLSRTFPRRVLSIPVLYSFLLAQGWTRLQPYPMGPGTVAPPARTTAGRAERPESDAGPFYSGATDPGSAHIRGLFRGSRHHEDALRAGSGHGRRPAGIHPGDRPAGGCANYHER